MSVTRGDFLKSLGKSLPGMVLGGGVATAAQKFLGKLSAVTGTVEVSLPAVAVKPEVAKIDFIRSGPTAGPRVALTFDDGPTPGVTELILDELKQRQLHATFFMIGQRIAAAPDLARRVLAEGHEVGNHTFTHPNLTTLPDAQVAVEIEKTQNIMAEVLHHRPTWFRPPFGSLRQNQIDLVQNAGLRVVLWNVDPADWSQPGETQIVESVLAETKPGSIIMCHDLHPQTAHSVGSMLDGLLQRGFSLEALSGLLG